MRKESFFPTRNGILSIVRLCLVHDTQNIFVIRSPGLGVIKFMAWSLILKSFASFYTSPFAFVFFLFNLPNGLSRKLCCFLSIPLGPALANRDDRAICHNFPTNSFLNVMSFRF